MVRSLTIRDATSADARWFAAELRTRDHEEVAATVGPGNVEAAIESAIRTSTGLCWVAEHGANPVLLLGCAPVAGRPGVGSPWLLGTFDADLYPGALTKVAKTHIAIMLRSYDTLVNRVDARNAVSVRWLARLGFEIEEPTPYGVEGRPFHRFTMGA